MNKLVFRYRYDADDDFGWLDVAVATANFSGRGGFWVQWQDIIEFGETLSTYPIKSESPLKGAWGYEMLEGDDLAVGVEIGPADARGNLRVQVELADHLEPSQRVRTSFITNYPDLDGFRLAIAQLMDRKTDEAILRGL